MTVLPPRKTGLIWFLLIVLFVEFYLPVKTPTSSSFSPKRNNEEEKPGLISIRIQYLNTNKDFEVRSEINKAKSL
ncbi:hypothetical protein L2E82_11160 [Cichorium intybus]|uniref:Uncharacterized protein n=1 Tax=Cichorium intybus TaxID=13427 RepID=A0ACB9GCP2_CICIN|nr:hypothetical protein L2E82_11160 [Cichorium intybus]